MIFYNNQDFFRVDLLWKGLRDGELEKASGINGAYFVHVNGFIGGARSLDGATEIANQSLIKNSK